MTNNTPDEIWINPETGQKETPYRGCDGFLIRYARMDAPAVDAGELEIPDGYALVEKEYLRHVWAHAEKWLNHLKYVEEAVVTIPDGLEKDIARLIDVTQPDQMRDEYRLAIKRIIDAARAHLESLRNK